MLQRIVSGRGGTALLRQNLLEDIPEGLRSEALRREVPQRVQDGRVIPVGDLSLGTRLTNAVNSGQQEIVSRRRGGAGRRPERLQQRKDTGLLGGKPEGAGQSEIAHGGGYGYGGSAVLDQGGDLFGGAEI